MKPTFLPLALAVMLAAGMCGCGKPQENDVNILNAIGRMKGYSGCGKCGGTWNHTKEHLTDYSGHGGCFPLCEPCWQSLTPETRLPYYENLGRDWFRWCGSVREQQEHEDKMILIRKAVLEGK